MFTSSFLMFFEKLIRKMLSLQHGFEHNTVRKKLQKQTSILHLYDVHEDWCCWWKCLIQVVLIFLGRSNKRDRDQIVTNTTETERGPRPVQIPHCTAHSKMRPANWGHSWNWSELTVHTVIAGCMCVCTHAPLEGSWWNKQKSFYFVFSKQMPTRRSWNRLNHLSSTLIFHIFPPTEHSTTVCKHYVFRLTLAFECMSLDLYDNAVIFLHLTGLGIHFESSLSGTDKAK